MLFLNNWWLKLGLGDRVGDVQYFFSDFKAWSWIPKICKISALSRDIPNSSIAIIFTSCNLKLDSGSNDYDLSIVENVFLSPCLALWQDGVAGKECWLSCRAGWDKGARQPKTFVAAEPLRRQCNSAVFFPTVEHYSVNTQQGRCKPLLTWCKS